jgi:RNA polymerase sigma-70 factor (ECF subfamily)
VSTSPSDTKSDRAIISDARNGDERAFNELVRRYQPTIYRFAYSVCRDHERAKLTTQDTFINVYRKLNTYDERSKFSTWLYSIVTNNCLMVRRSERSGTVSMDEPAIQDQVARMPSSRPGPVKELLNEELKEQVDKAILKLPLDYRLVLLLRDMEGLSAAEVAKVLQISIPAVKSRLFRARDFLRKALRPFATTA